MVLVSQVSNDKHRARLKDRSVLWQNRYHGKSCTNEDVTRFSVLETVAKGQEQQRKPWLGRW